MSDKRNALSVKIPKGKVMAKKQNTLNTELAQVIAQSVAQALEVYYKNNAKPVAKKTEKVVVKATKKSAKKDTKHDSNGQLKYKAPKGEEVVAVEITSGGAYALKSALNKLAWAKFNNNTMQKIRANEFIALKNKYLCDIEIGKKSITIKDSKGKKMLTWENGCEEKKFAVLDNKYIETIAK